MKKKGKFRIERKNNKIIIQKNQINFLFLVPSVLSQEQEHNAPCVDDSKFYRNPNTLSRNVWTPSECAKYYLCLGKY